VRAVLDIAQGRRGPGGGKLHGNEPIAAPMHTPLAISVIGVFVACAAAFAQAPPGEQLPVPPGSTVPPPPTRGQLLYDMHCSACHSSQIHWRDARGVRDWPGLVSQVHQWQERAKLQWSAEDIGEVARHLNDTIYRLPRPGDTRG
jgi:cytochrome c5